MILVNVKLTSVDFKRTLQQMVNASDKRKPKVYSRGSLSPRETADAPKMAAPRVSKMADAREPLGLRGGSVVSRDSAAVVPRRTKKGDVFTYTLRVCRTRRICSGND